MPELPEVETVRRIVAEHIRGKEMIAVEVNHSGVLDGISDADFSALLLGHAVEDMKRRGKYLIFCLDDGRELLLHLRMTGQLVYFEDDFEQDKHCHVIVRFAQGGWFYRDVRRFGRFCPIGVDGKTECGLKKLGLEPMDRQFTLNYVKDGLQSRRGPIKSRLLDQEFIAGIGNIYADEILFEARIHPQKPCSELTNCQLKRLKKAAETVLEEAIAHRGTTFSDYRDGYGRVGGHQEHLKVFHRGGKTCPRCGETIVTLKCGGRTTSYCPKCQKR
ncbi:MAG TPA: bifunctional DNA-formamidopyrimidine glycosylase/DNA-(apurinic or apyrimidinic site) lyase [Clostridiales bacterium]|nr:bifunctional DNA-formamidopyrimidine glycosylase/DNA-(apurinic or apyrimidinic site) lyase [Clostridiales bacterium]